MTIRLSQKQTRSIALALVLLVFVGGATFRAAVQSDDNLIRRILSTLTDHQFGLPEIKQATDGIKAELTDPQHGLAKIQADVQTNQVQIKQVVDGAKAEITQAVNGVK